MASQKLTGDELWFGMDLPLNDDAVPCVFVPWFCRSPNRYMRAVAVVELSEMK